MTRPVPGGVRLAGALGLGLGLVPGCSGSFQDQAGQATAQDWGGPPGTYLELIPAGAPDGLPLLVEIGADQWELRYGETWRTAQELGTVAASADGDGYRVGDSLLVPAGLEVGASADGSTIQERGPVETWYGTFEDALTVEVGGGDFRGTAAFAADVGPILLAWQGLDWELAWYEREY